MPFTEKQHRVFQAIAHGFKPHKKSLRRITQAQAAEMAAEGVKQKIGLARRSHGIGRGVRKSRRTA